jgi:hypothetical protein
MRSRLQNQIARVVGALLLSCFLQPIALSLAQHLMGTQEVAATVGSIHTLAAGNLPDRTPAGHESCYVQSSICATECASHDNPTWCSNNRCELALAQCTGDVPTAAAYRLPDECKAFDRDAVGIIEKQGTILIAAPHHLAQAYMDVVRARAACAEGRLAEAMALYEGIAITFSESSQAVD